MNEETQEQIDKLIADVKPFIHRDYTNCWILLGGAGFQLALWGYNIYRHSHWSKLVKKGNKLMTLDLTGRKFGKLTVLSFSHSTGYKRFWKCLCECGNVRAIRGDALTSKGVSSCNCMKGPRTLGGLSRKHKPEYWSWKAMQVRCLNPKNHGYKRYGGRGITICERWSSFALFLEDMGPRPKGHTLERKNNNLGYTPENCCWATPKQQANNRRPATKGRT